MKKHLFLGILLLLVSGIHAGKPMFLPDTEWHYYETDLFSNTSNKRTYTIQDTLVDGVAYQYVRGVLLRSEGAKVWCMTDSAGKKVEQLLYDFDLQVGDSIRTVYFEYYADDPDFYAKVTKVETITLSDGRKARRISYDNRHDDIEHVGNILGIIEAAMYVLPPNGIIEKFVCCVRGDNVLYETATGECENLDKTTAIPIFRTDIPSVSKLLRDGQILILQNDKTYTITGQRVK